jgi:hypothetical protein
MFFKKTHKLLIEKPLNIIKSDLKSKTENLTVTEISEVKLSGLMEFPFNRYSVESDITLNSETDEKVSVEFKNSLDYRTDIILILIFIMCWGISINEFLNGNEILKFEVIFPFIFPIIGILIGQYSFSFYDKKIMNKYKSLLTNKEPN